MAEDARDDSVRTNTPAIDVAFFLAADGEDYVAHLRLGADRKPIVILNLPRTAVDSAVLDAAQTRLEVRLDGTVAAYLEVDSRTLTSAGLSELIAGAVSADSLAADDNPALMSRLEAELERALALVRRARA